MKIFYACFFAFCTTVTQAQSIHSKIPVNELSNLYAGLHLQGLVLNDSLFVAAPSNKKGPTRAFWILPSGEVVHINSPELKNKSFVSLAGVGDNIFFYYLEQLKNGIFLRANVQNRQTSLVTTDKALVPVHGSFVSVFPFNKAWYLLSVLDSTNEIHMSTIQGMEKVKHTVIKSPFPLTTGTSPFTFISQDAMVTPLLAASSNKIYLQNRYLYITMDQKASGGKKAQTSLLKVNLETGETETRIFIESSKKYFSTFIYDRYLFKITKSRASGAVISIHSLDDYSLLQTFTIKEPMALAQNRSFKRDLTKTTDKESVWDAVSNNAAGFIMATSVDSTHFMIRVGSYHLISRSAAGFIPAVSSYPLLAMAGLAARAIAYSFSEMESVDHYFYLQWNLQTEPTFSDKPIDVMQVIDHYDIASFKEKKKFAYKAYLKENSKIFGIYHESGSPSVNILLFEAH